jgi:hypothetical protein
MYMTWSPVRFELKAIREPSGDHDGYSPPLGVGPDPEARPVPSDHRESFGTGEAISDPSADQATERPAVNRR